MQREQPLTKSAKPMQGLAMMENSGRSHFQHPQARTQNKQPKIRSLSAFSISMENFIWLYFAPRMSMEDFCKSFCQLDICNYSAAFLDGSCESHWNTSVYDGRWLAGSTAGGPMTFPSNYYIMSY